MKLNTKILLFVLPLLVIPISSIGFIAYQKLNQSSLEASIQQAQTILDEIRSNIQYFNLTTHSNLELFANDPLIHKYVLTDEESRYDLLLTSLLRLFGSYQQAYSDYYEIRIIMPDGYEDARKTNREIDNFSEDESATPIFTKIKSNDTNVTSFFANNPDNDQFSYYASKPLVIKDRGSDSLSTPPKLRAYLSVTVSIDWLIEKINNTAISDSGIIFITDFNGRVLLTKRNQNTIPPSDNLIKILHNHTTYERFNNLNHITKNGNDTLFLLKNTPGYLWSAPVSDQFMLFIWHPNKDILENSSQLAIRITLIALISVIALSFLTFNLLNYLIVAPIRKLEKSSKAIGRGDLISSIEVHTNDEIGSLAETFNTMSQNLLRSNEQIKYLAYHDELTGLPNRLMFLEYVNQAIARAKRFDQKFAILYLDLDNFKRVNDTMGHKAGDLLLKEVSDRVLGCLRESDYAARSDNEISDIAARIGGDEFLLLLHDIEDDYLPGKIAKRIIDSLSHPITISSSEFFVGVSIGIAVYPNDSQSPDDLIKHADIAMYHAKNHGKNNYQFFLESMNEGMLKRMALESKLRTAIKDNQLFLHYQPQISLKDGHIYGVEALVRWNDPDTGMIHPNTFIPIAEETGLIIDLGEWVLKTACQQVRDWQLANLNPIKLSVNFSAIQFSKVDVPDLISRTLNETGLDAKYLVIEITETVIMEDIERVSSILNKIREFGCTISLDDFGTGYSSLNYLRQFPLDTLKIDRSFVSEIVDTSDNKKAIIIAIIAMSHALNLKVIAEGIETEQQNEKLIEWQCDYIQGFYLHRPMPAIDLEKLIHRTRPAPATP